MGSAMPVYTYSCDECGEKFEKVLPMSRASEPSECPECGKDAERTVSGVFENNSTRNRASNFPKRKRYTNW